MLLLISNKSVEYSKKRLITGMIIYLFEKGIE
jgi:hypothetical protein